MPDRDADRVPGIPAPSGPPITSPAYKYNGEDVTPGMIIRLARFAFGMMKPSRDEILKIRAFRRGEESSRIQLNPKWARKHPEAAGWVREKMEQRRTLDRDMVAKAGAIEPTYRRKPLGFKDTDVANAASCTTYLNEWYKQSVPYQAFIGKNVEDGQFGLACIPAFADMDGAPDFFEMLEERAYQQLPAENRKRYQKLEGDRRGRYVRLNEDGTKKRNPKIDRGTKEDSEKAHSEAVQRYLLDKRAVNIRIIPALDCAPVFVRSADRDRWECVALVERTLYYPQELLHNKMGWKGMGDRRLVPVAYESDGSSMRISRDEVGTNGQFYLYTAYIVCETEDGKRRPVIASTVGGTATWNDASGNEHDPNSVTILDLYELTKTTREDGTESGLEGPLWGYFGGLHTEDDDPAHYWYPYLSDFYDRIRGIEGNKTSINAASTVQSFTGHFNQLDPRWAATEDGLEAALDSKGDLRRPKMPGPGEIETTTGTVVPAAQARTGEDAWRIVSMDMGSLQQQTATDQIQPGDGSSARAMVVQNAISDVSKRQIREGAVEAVVFCGEAVLRILTAYAHRWGVRWPLQTTEERPVGRERREGQAPTEFDPDWVGDNQFKVTAELPKEENLARQDLRAKQVEQGLAADEDVWEEMGITDFQGQRAKVLKSQMFRHPAVIEAGMTRLASESGNKELQAILKLKNAGRMGQQDLPVIGAQPTVAVQRPGGGSGPTQVSSSRGGDKAAAMQTGPQRVEGEMVAQVTGAA